MTTVEIIEIYGISALNHFHQLDDDNLKKVLMDIIGNIPTSSNISEVVNVGSVTRVITDMSIMSITISFYDQIEITAFGIRLIPEHGITELLVRFDQSFKFPE